MFKKMLFKSVVGTAVAGTALALSLAATTAPEIQTVACGPYAGSAPTTTSVSLSRSFATYGQTVTATASVSGPKRGGDVRIVLSREGGSRIKTWDVALRGGGASVTLPRLEARSSYSVTARYFAPDCSRFQDSRWSKGSPLTVYAARTGTQVNAPDVWALRGAHASAVVSSKSPYTVPGQVRFTVYRNGHQVKSVTSSLSREKASAGFGKLPVGSYTVRAVYLGSQNFARSAGSDAFRVTK